MVEKVEFKGVWIPRALWNDNAIGWSEKIILAEIDRLVENGRCFASNRHFAKFFNLSQDRISKLIASLKEKGYIETKYTYKADSKEIDQRVITTIGYRRKQLQGISENTDTPIGENAEDNITVINRTINKTNISKTNVPGAAPPVFDIPDFNDEDEQPTPVGKITKSVAAAPPRTIKKEKFDIWWARYNKKKSKDKCLSKWFLMSMEEIDLAVECVEDHVLITPDVQYRKHPITWLNQKCWEDDIAEELKKFRPRGKSTAKLQNDNDW